MSTAVSYTSIAIVEFLPSEIIAIEVISVTPETCELSGAWLIEPNNLAKLNQIIDGRLVIFMGDKSKLTSYVATYPVSEVDLQDFIDEARKDASSALQAFGEYISQNELEYKTYMSIKLTERRLLPKVIKKKLVLPEFYAWPETLEINSAEEFLTSRGELGNFIGTDIDIKNALIGARLVKHLVDMWRSDEIERSNRLYVNDNEAIVSIIPTIWLQKIKNQS